MPKGVYKRTKEHNRKNSEARKDMPPSERGHKLNCQCCCCKSSRGEFKHSDKAKEKISLYHANQIKEKNHNWKGGQFTDSSGYVRILMPEHPRSNKNGYVRRSHLIAEKKLGRYLYPYEITHHENEIRDDDGPKNIKVTTQSKHTFLHNKIRKQLKEILK